MTTSVLDRVPVDKITAEAKQVRFWATVLRLIAFTLFGAGWLAAKGFAMLWLALAWAAVAIRTGWQEGRAQSPRRAT